MSHKKILIVDDEAEILEALSMLLESTNYEVISETNPKKALARIQTEHFDLLITDVLMPKMSGFQLFTEVRKTHLELPILFSTGDEPSVKFREKYETKYSNFITKPFSQATFQDKINHFLNIQENPPKILKIA